MVCSGVCHVTMNIFASLCAVVMRQLALQIDSLSDGGIGLKIQAIPQLTLPHKDKRHGTLRIHLEVQQESYFLQHLAVQQMRLVDNDHGLQPVNAAHELNLSVQLALRVAAVELRLTAKLLEQSLVEVSRCQLGVRQVERLVLSGVELFREAANRRRLAYAAVAGDDCEPLPLSGIFETTERLF